MGQINTCRKQRIAKGIGELLIANTNTEAQFDWGNVSVQGGDIGVVFSKNDTYTTAFVEVFPKNPRTFIRGEGKTIQEAEASAWEQYQRIMTCDHHAFERREYRNGAAICTHCGLFQTDVFVPLEVCVICATPTYQTCDIDNNWYCIEHRDLVPEEKQTESYKWAKRYRETHNK